MKLVYVDELKQRVYVVCNEVCLELYIINRLVQVSISKEIIFNIYVCNHKISKNKIC